MDRDSRPRSDATGLDRRDFLKGTGAVVAASTLMTVGGEVIAQEEPRVYKKNLVSSDPGKIVLRVNGAEHELTLEPRVTLLEALRIDLGLTGTKEVEETTAAGADTVLISGKPVLANSRLAIECEGLEITTIEGIAVDDPIIIGLLQHDAVLCGYCTPGVVMALKGLFHANSSPSLTEIDSALGGNLCRCGAYAKIRDCALELARRGGAD